MRNLIFYVFLLVIPNLSNAGTNAAAFLDIGVGARAMGMAGTYVAIADDATATYWNPAGIGQLWGPELVVSTTGSLLGDDNILGSEEGISFSGDQHRFFSFVSPIGQQGAYGTAGLSFIQFGLGEIEWRTSEYDPNPTLVENSENAYVVSYGIDIVPDELMVGANVKILQQSFKEIDDASASGFSPEFGILYSPTDGLMLGLAAQAETKMNWKNGHSDDIPAKTRAGVSYGINKSLLVAAELRQKTDQSLKGNVGGEYTYTTTTGIGKKEKELLSFSVRSGIGELEIEKRYGPRSSPVFTAGAGFAFNASVAKIKIDFGAAFEDLGMQQRYSFGVSF
jgi:long-subunit fatty acid transport protein